MKKFERMSPEEKIQGIEEYSKSLHIFKSSLIETMQKMNQKIKIFEKKCS